MRGQLQISAVGPVDENGKHITQGSDIPWTTEGKVAVNKDKTVLLLRSADDSHCRKIESIYGRRVKRMSADLLEKRAEADADGKDNKDNGAYLYETVEEQCEARGMDLDKFRESEARFIETRSAHIPEYKRRAIERRGLDGGTDTALVGVDYAHEWFRDLRLAGKLVPEFSRQMDIAEGYSSYTGPVVGDALFMKQGALTSNAFTVNSAYNPTSTVVTLTPQKIQAVIFVSGELTEDSLAPVIENLKMSMLRGANVAIEHILLNGDTLDSTANINSYATTALGDLDVRFCWDGLRAMDWKSSTGKSASSFSGSNGANGVVTLDGILGGLKAMGKYSDDPSKVLTIMPVRSEKEALADTKARPDTYSALIDASSGRLVTVGGSKVITVGNSIIDNTHSSEVPTYATFLSEGYPINLAATGLYTGSGATSGFVQVREDNILWGWKRQFSFKVVDLPLGDQVAITATLRVVAKQIITGVGVANSFNWA